MSPAAVPAEITRLPVGEPVVALTFDAGSNADGVPRILGTLQATGTPATFFVTGKWVDSYPEYARRIAAAYPVGNHTLSHPYLTRLPDPAVTDEISSGEAEIRKVTGRPAAPLFRFPYGDSDERTLHLAARAGFTRCVRWTIDTLGWRGRSVSAGIVRERVLQALQPGAIVLMHVGSADDGSTLDADALPALIDEVRARGYRFVTVAETA